MKYGKTAVILVLIFCLAACGRLISYGADDETVWNFDLDGEVTDWKGAHPSAADLIYDNIEEAAKINVYSISYLGDGNVATRIMADELGIKVSANENRFLKVRMYADPSVAAYHFTKSVVRVQHEGDAAHTELGPEVIGADTFAGLTDNEGYIETIIDLGFQEEKTLNMLRVDLIAEEIGSGSESKIGYLYIKYIGLFDSREEAEQYRSHKITVAEDIANGSVSADEMGASYSQIRITAVPEEGQSLRSLTVAYGDQTLSLGKGIVALDSEENVYLFTMPEADVTISAEFGTEPTETEAPAPTEEPDHTADKKTAVPSTKTPDKAEEDTTRSQWVVPAVICAVIVVAAGIAIFFVVKKKK